MSEIPSIALEATCLNCRHWNHEPGEIYPEWFGECTAVRPADMDHIAHVNVYLDVEDRSAEGLRLCTGPDFGCNGHEPGVYGDGELNDHLDRIAARSRARESEK